MASEGGREKPRNPGIPQKASLSQALELDVGHLLQPRLASEQGEQAIMLLHLGMWASGFRKGWIWDFGLRFRNLGFWLKNPKIENFRGLQGFVRFFPDFSGFR